MTTFDRAFIKAFTETPAHPGAPPAKAVAPPHVPQTKSAPARLGGSPARASELGEPAPRPTKTAPPPQPLSSFTPQPKLHDGCRALLEVDRFHWPTAVEELLAKASSQWDLFAEQLVAQMGQGKKCLAIGSLTRGVGRTAITLAIAKHLAARGQRTVAVDADPERPGLVRTCGVSVHTGWDDLVSSELSLGESLIASIEEGITVMPWRTAVPGGRALPASLRVSTLFGSLREHYDLILLDCAPMTGKTAIADFAAFAKAAHLDALYLVHNLNQPAHRPLAELCSRLSNAGLPLAGVIENFVTTAAPRLHAANTGSTALPRTPAAARLAD